MDNIEFESTQYTPQIRLIADKGIISISGKSYPENSYGFYQPVVAWISKYFAAGGHKKTIVNLEIIYFNSGSSKVLYDLFDIFDEICWMMKSQIPKHRNHRISDFWWFLGFRMSISNISSNLNISNI